MRHQTQESRRHGDPSRRGTEAGAAPHFRNPATNPTHQENIVDAIDELIIHTLALGDRTPGFGLTKTGESIRPAAGY